MNDTRVTLPHLRNPPFDPKQNLYAFISWTTWMCDTSQYESRFKVATFPPFCQDINGVNGGDLF